MENGLILVVAQFEILCRAVEVLFQHWHIVVLQSVVDRQVAIEVTDVGPGSDLVHDGVLLVDADDVLDRLSFEVLLTPSFEEFVRPREPVEDVFVAVAGTLEQRILSKIILLGKCLILVLSEDLEHLHVLGLDGSEEGAVSLEVGLHALFWSHLEELLREVELPGPGCHMQGRVSSDTISAIEDVQVGEQLLIKKISHDFGLLVFDGREEASLAISVALLEQLVHLLVDLSVAVHIGGNNFL